MNIEKLQDYQCSGCCACANACPRNAITMRENMEGFIYPVIDHALCIECSACDRACTQVHEWLQEEDMLNRNSVPQAYAVINDNPLTRDKSSSGGGISTFGGKSYPPRRNCIWCIFQRKMGGVSWQCR